MRGNNHISLLLLALIILACCRAAAGITATATSCPKPVNHAQYKYKNMMDATAAVHCQVFGEEELYSFSPKMSVCPTIKAAEGSSVNTLPVKVEVQVSVGKIKIDTREQVATVKWWLRQKWTDPRNAWNASDYTYDMGNGEVGTVTDIRRVGGAEGGTWIPELVLLESHFDGTMATMTSESTPPMLEMYDTGAVFWSVPQQVRFNMVPRMDLGNFPFDTQNVTFTIGAWINSMKFQNTSFYLNSQGMDDPKLFIDIQGDRNQVDSTGAPGPFQGSFNRKKDVDFIATEEWQYKSKSAVRHEDDFPCCPHKYAYLEGTITLRRQSNFYVKFGVLPQILMTCFGFVAAAFRGHRTGNVTFIAGTGFTVALALMAHAVFFVDKLPVQRSTSFMEFTFLWSFCLALSASCVSIYLYKKTEHNEEHLNDLRLKAKESQTFKDMPRRKQRTVRWHFWLDQMLIPAHAMLYCFGLMIAAKQYGAVLKDEFLTEIFLMTGFMLIVIAGASYDMWKSADMIYASHRHYKRSLKEWISQALPCLSYDEENDENFDKSFVKRMDTLRIQVEEAALTPDRKGRLEKAKEFLDKGFLTQDEYNHLENTMVTANDSVTGAC